MNLPNNVNAQFMCISAVNGKEKVTVQLLYKDKERADGGKAGIF